MKLIKKYQQGTTLTPAWTVDTFDNLPTRKYYWKQWTPEMKIKTDYYTGKPLDERWKVLVDDQGNVVDTSNPQVQADYVALSGNGKFKAELPEVTFTFDKNTKQKFVQPTTETADERIERTSNAPIATQKQWEEIKKKEDEENFNQTPEGHKIWLRQKDLEANAKTPGAGMLFAAPTALGVGATMFLTNPLAFITSLGGAKIGEATLDHPFQQQGYKSFGDWLFEGTNTPDWIKSGSNVGTLLGGGAGWSLANKYLATTKNLIKHTAQDALKKSILSNYQIPKQIENAIATEAPSYTPQSIIRQPAVLFSKTGDINKGSLISRVKEGINNFFRNDPVWNFMERTGIPEEQRTVVEKVLIKPTLDQNKNWYTDPWSNITYAIKTPQATDKELMNQFTTGLTSRFKQYKTDPQLKAAIQQEMGWDDETYNNFLKEITKKMMEENSIGVSGKEELSGNLARTTHLKIENPEQATRYATQYLINRDRIAGESSNIAQELQYAKEAGVHEGYHGITSGINGEADAAEKGIQNEYPLITSLMERNRKFLQNVAETQEWYNYFNNTPVYKVVSDLKASGFTPEQIEYVTEFGLPRAKSYNRYVLEPQETSARDVVTTTLGPGTKNEEQLRNIYTPESFNKFHGKLFSKTGDVNEGSLTGTGRNWQIRALAPGNPLEKRVNPQGLVSWKNIDWYLQRPSISAYDKGHITEALKGFPKDTPINYAELQKASKRLIPKFTLKPQTAYQTEGLDKINYGINDIESIQVNSFHTPTVGHSGHYPDAFGHNRYFTSTADKDVLYVSEIQNDGAQQILQYVAGDPLVRSFETSQAINPQTIHMSETYPQRQIQEALLYAHRQGKSKVRFPTRDTIYKIEKYDENIVLNEQGERLQETLDNNWYSTMSTLESKYAPELNQLRTLKNQRLVSYYRATERFYNLCRQLQGAFPEGKISKNLDYNSLPDNFLGDEMASNLAMQMLRNSQQDKNELFKELQDFSKKIIETLEAKVYPKEEYIKARQEYAQKTKYIEDNFGSPDTNNNIILDRYEAFPKHFRSLFGNKNDVRIVTDSKNNTWYEVDVPQDIESRTLLFNKVGEVNKGSVVGASRRPIIRKNIHKFSDAEWDAAYEAALEKGNKREMWRLLTLRFQQKAKEYVATQGGDPMILWRGLYREPEHVMRPSGVWLSSDKNYTLNFTTDAEDYSLQPILDERKIFPYFVKGHQETLFPHNTYYDLPENLRTPKNYDWKDLYQELIWGVPKSFRRYAENTDKLVSFAIEHGATSQDIKNTFFKDPVKNKIYAFGKADVIAGHDLPMSPITHPHWIPSQGLEYNVKNPNYVKLAKLITYDDNGNMIPLSQRFNFRLNDRRYSWLLPLVPFLYPNKKDQAE